MITVSNFLGLAYTMSCGQMFCQSGQSIRIYPLLHGVKGFGNGVEQCLVVGSRVMIPQ